MADIVDFDTKNLRPNTDTKILSHGNEVDIRLLPIIKTWSIVSKGFLDH